MFAGLMALTLAACGTEASNPASQVVRGVVGLIQSGPKAPLPGPDDLLTRDVIDQVTVPYAMVGIERRGAYASMTLAGQNGPFNSWVTSDSAGVIMRGDIVTATKGLGADLAAADVTGIAEAVRANRAATLRREHRYLDGEGRVFGVTYDCTYAPAGAEEITIIGRTYDTDVMTETCVAGDERFENRYWTGRGDGIVWQSRQWVSNGVGPILFLNLVPIAN